MGRINPRRAKLHRAYDVGELADRVGAHKNTVRNWIREGLPVVDGAKPTLILGSEFQTWWAKRAKARKRPCKPGQMYCLKCRAPKSPALGMVEYAAKNFATGTLKAMCETCGTMMHLNTRRADIAARMPSLAVQIRQAPSSIDARAHPSSKCDNLKGA